MITRRPSTQNVTILYMAPKGATADAQERGGFGGGQEARG